MWRNARPGIMREGSEWQRAWSSLAECATPVLACIHGACIGAALELVCCADIRCAPPRALATTRVPVYGRSQRCLQLHMRLVQLRRRFSSEASLPEHKKQA